MMIHSFANQTQTESQVVTLEQAAKALAAYTKEGDKAYFLHLLRSGLEYLKAIEQFQQTEAREDCSNA